VKIYFRKLHNNLEKKLAKTILNTKTTNFQSRKNLKRKS
jgi:hypothetical protein